MESRNDQMPERLKLTSKDIIRAYGRTLDGTAVCELFIHGCIEPQDFIEIYDINKTLKMVDYDNIDIFDDEELRAVYTPTRLVDMKKNGLLTPYFIEKYTELEEFEKNPAVFRGKSLDLVDEILKDKPEGFEKEVLDFFDIGFCDLETAKEIITPKYIEKEIEKGEISKENLFEFYKKGFVDENFILNYYTDREILDLYEKGSIPSDCLKSIKDPDNIIQYFCDDKIGIQDLVSLYLKSGNFSVKDLSDAIELNEENEYDISAFIDETTPFEKIKELFSNLLIDYSSILRLRNQGIINEEQFSEIKTALDTREFFQEIRDGKRYTVITSRERDGVERVTPIVPRYKDEEDYSDEMKIISTILERDVEDEDYGLIESYNSKGKPTSLNNYRIFGNEKLDGIVILQKSKKGNAVFVMSALQMMYFLKGKENENGEFEVQDRMKDKSYLRTIEGVEVVEHSKFFGRNLVEACSRVSEKVSGKLKVSDKKYRKDVAEMVDDMLDKYLMDRGKSII